MTREERRQFVLAYAVLVRRYEPTEEEAMRVTREAFAVESSSLASKVLDALESVVTVKRKAR